MQHFGNQQNAYQNIPQPELGSQRNQPVAAIYWCNISVNNAIEDLSTDAGRHFTAAVKIAANNSKSPIYWGRTVENPDVLVCIVCRDVYGYDSLEAHTQARQAPWRFAASKLFLKVCKDYPKAHHVDFQEPPYYALEAPVTLLACAFFRSGSESTKKKSSFEQMMHKYNIENRLGTHNRPGAQPLFMGWALENDISYRSLSGQRGIGSAYYMLSGWPSIEAEHHFHLSEGMQKESREMIMGGADGWKLMHVQFSRVEPDTA